MLDNELDIYTRVQTQVELFTLYADGSRLDETRSVNSALLVVLDEAILCTVLAIVFLKSTARSQQMMHIPSAGLICYHLPC